MSTSAVIEDDSVSRQQKWHLGRTRIRDASGCVATVVYVGPVASAHDPHEIYCGVVWDDPTRGKHDGSVIDRNTGQLVRHFQAPHPTSGSFVKQRKVDPGVTLSPELLRSRYVSLQSDECVAPDNLLPHTVQTASGRNDKKVEFLGELKIRSQQQLEDLSAVSLRRWGISSVQSDVTAWTSLSHITEVDLAGNLLFDWKEVSNLLEGLPSLRNLSLACNRLGDCPTTGSSRSAGSDVPTTSTTGFAVRALPRSSNMEILNLRQTAIKSTGSILEIGRAFPNLKELSLSDNDLECNLDDATQLASAFPVLSFLDGSNCGIKSCRQVLAWSLLSCLESLSLDNNPNLSSWEGLDPSLHFGSLQQLQLAHTGFESWTELCEPLHRLPKLQRLRLRSCPLQAGLGAGQARVTTIGFLPKLLVLNGSPVSQTEQKDAARWYLRASLRSQQQSDGSVSNRNVVPSDSPQLEYWRTHHADLLKEADSAFGADGPGKALIDTIINVTIRSMAANSCTMDPLVRRFPAEMTIGRLKSLCGRHFGLDLDLQALSYRSSPDQGFPTVMEGDEYSLAYYGVPDGAEILMNEIDVAALNLEEEKAAAFMERVDRQEKELQDFQARQKRLAIR